MTTNYLLKLASDSLCDKVILFLESEQKLVLDCIKKTKNKKDIENIILNQIQLIESISVSSEFISDFKLNKLERKKTEFISVLISSL